MSSRPCLNCGMTVSENARFCTECGCELLHEPAISSKAQNPSGLVKSAKKGFGIGAKIGLGLGVIFFLIIIAGAIAGSNTGSTQSSSSSTTTAEQQAIDFVQNYKGPSSDGYSLSQIITVIVDATYPNENILDNPSTEHGWMALRDYNQNGNIWKVEFDLKTYRENVKIVWYANMDTHTIYSGNTIAKNILDTVNLPNNSTNSTLSNIHLT